MSNRQFHLEWRDADNSFTRDTFDSVKTILDKLVELGELHEIGGDPGYYRLPLKQKKVVRAGYKKDYGDMWCVTCSEHGSSFSPGYNSPERARREISHFRAHHKNDTVEWYAPPKKVSITYAFIDGRYHYGCSDHPTYCKPFNGSGTHGFSYIQARSRDHVRTYHPDDDVFFGKVPKPPTHKHHWVWGVEQYGPSSKQRTVIRCQSYDCGVRFYHPEGLIDQDYTGPVPPNL